MDRARRRGREQIIAFRGPGMTAYGFNLIGFASANLGHGVALRNTASVLRRSGHPFGVLDIDPGDNRTGKDMSLADHFLPAGKPLPHAINLFHLNPPAIEALVRDLPGLIETRGRFNACVSFWELPKLPLAWIQALETMDLILAPSRFIQSAIGDVVRTTPILHYPQFISLPRADSARARWGITPGKTAFLFSFDVSSGVQRKNPMAVMEAFRNAFPPGHAELILKVNNRDQGPAAALVVDRLKDAARLVPGIRILDESIPYGDVMSLYASIDVLVSLHRGEGLGLSLMECMALGKPVITTGWSGNMDFTDGENSCLVPYSLVPLEPGSQYHALSQGVDQVWAEPSVPDAVEWMRRLDASRELRLEIGERGRASITRFVEEAGKGRVFEEAVSRFRKTVL
jgi:glycosyltransferase involved in cell wall biosynthesis